MNERIRQLAEQAEWFAGTEYNKQTMATFHTNKSAEELFKEKFAELIVRDVLVICDAVSEPFGDSEMDKNIPGALVVAEMVKENFGVSE